MPDQDNHDRTVADRLVELRRQRGLTQEQLSERSKVSYTVIRKLEGGGTARMDTLHALARALGVQTVWFMTPDTPTPAPSPMRDAVLSDMRSAVNPPAGLGGRIYPDDDTPPNLDMLGSAVANVAEFYQDDRYDDIARLVPGVVRSAHQHVRHLDGRDRDRARYLRADALQLAGRYLIQIREHDLALMALRDALDDALEIGAEDLAAVAIAQQGWALMRQGRFGEVEALCVASADAIEPRMSRATPGQLAAWGRLLVRAAAAAARNNRPEEARDLQRLADGAAAQLGQEHDGAGHVRFGPVTAGMNALQNELVSGRPDRALEMADELRGKKGATPTVRNRYQLDRAIAHRDMGDGDRATAVLSRLRTTAPAWFRQQQAARDVAEDVMRMAKRMPSKETRENARFLGIVL